MIVLSRMELQEAANFYYGIFRDYDSMTIKIIDIFGT